MSGRRDPCPLQLTGVTHVFGTGSRRVVAVDDIDLEVRPGEVVVIVGPSGSGKSTLLSITGCLLRPSAGRVEVMGVDVTALRESQLPDVRARRIGFVFQAFNLLAPLSVEENVLIAMNLAGQHGAEARGRVHELLESLGLTERAAHNPRELSAGEQQRVAIARALGNRPDVILADEPTASLDSRSGGQVMDLLVGAIRNGEAKALVVVTHDQRILDRADRVLWMSDGRLSENPQEALRAGL